MKIPFKRAASLICTLALCASMIPTTAFANDDSSTSSSASASAAQTVEPPAAENDLSSGTGDSSTDVAGTIVNSGDSASDEEDKLVNSEDSSAASVDKDADSGDSTTADSGNSGTVVTDEGDGDSTISVDSQSSSSAESDSTAPDTAAQNQLKVSAPAYAPANGVLRSNKNDNSKNYTWNLAAITPNGDGYNIVPNDSDTDNVTVQTRDKSSNEWEELAPDTSCTDHYLRFTPADGYYIQYMVFQSQSQSNHKIYDPSNFDISMDATGATIIDVDNSGDFDGNQICVYIQLAEIQESYFTVTYNAGTIEGASLPGNVFDGHPIVEGGTSSEGDLAVTVSYDQAQLIAPPFRTTPKSR